MAQVKSEQDRASAIAAYKSVLARAVDNRPSGTRHRLALALRMDSSFVSQILNPACAVPIPPVHLEAIFQVCHFTPGEKGAFLAAYTQANALESFEHRELRATIEHMHRVELELVHSEERYRALYHDNPSMYFTITPSGTVLSVNQFGARQLGYAAEELVGRSVLSVFVEEDRPKALAHVAECMANPGRVHHWELRKVRKDGSLLWVKETARAVHGADEQPVVLVVCEDITERKRAEEAEAALRRSRSLLAMGELVAGVAHEVRNPLFAISANLDLFERKLGTRTDCADMIAVLRAESSRLAALMQDLLDYGRPATQTRVLVSLDEAIADAVSACQELARKSRVELVNEARGLAPVLMDRNRLVQVFQNLVANAIQHSPPDGQVLIEVPEASGEGGLWVACSVADQGPGLPPEHLHRVFEPFFTRRRGGTGLGLSIAQRIVEDHEGLLTAENQPKGGARFTVKLPASAPAAEEARERVPPASTNITERSWVA